MKTIARVHLTVSGDELKRQLAVDRAADEAADEIAFAVETPTGLGLDMDLRHLGGQVRRQRDLPRDPARDGRFLLHLEHALRDLAVRGVPIS